MVEPIRKMVHAPIPLLSNRCSAAVRPAALPSGKGWKPENQGVCGAERGKHLDFRFAPGV